MAHMRSGDEASIQGVDEEFREERVEKTICRVPRSQLIVCILNLVFALAFVITGLWLMHEAEPPFLELVLASDIMVHLDQFQAIAEQYGGSRSTLTGFNASLAYVKDYLEKQTDLEVTVQTFPVKAYSQLAPPVFGWVDTTSGSFTSFNPIYFGGVTYSGSGTVQSNYTYIKDSGCFKSDYPSRIENIALVNRGDCSYATQVSVAVSQGAIAVIIINITPDVPLGNLGTEVSASIPVILVSSNLGDQLLTDNTYVLRIVTSGIIIQTVSQNLIATTKGGLQSGLIVVGSHLDSSDNSPGINDNGSGAAANLNMAVLFSSYVQQYVNKVAFIWFGASENGLAGSQYYVRNAIDTQTFGDIAVMLDIRMIGSPNYVLGYYDSSTGTHPNLQGSITVQKAFAAYFEAHNLSSVLFPLDGTSDYEPFMLDGVPVGGVFSGGDTEKTMDERAEFGGLANVAYDPCYQESCDSIDNINDVGLQYMAQAIAHIVHDFAVQTDLKSFLSTGSK